MLAPVDQKVNGTGHGAIVERVVINGDLAALRPDERIVYYRAVCESVGLNPLTRPFEYIKLDGRLTLYARKDATDQLRRLHGVSITDVQQQTIEDLFLVTVKAATADGRTDSDTGAVTIGHLQGNAKANALMRAITKAKRRVTLSICGLGWLDETELETIPSAAPVKVDTATGEIVDGEVDEQPTMSEAERAIMGAPAASFLAIVQQHLPYYGNDFHVKGAMRKMGYNGIPGAPADRVTAFQQLQQYAELRAEEKAAAAAAKAERKAPPVPTDYTMGDANDDLFS